MACLHPAVLAPGGASGVVFPCSAQYDPEGLIQAKGSNLLPTMASGFA